MQLAWLGCPGSCILRARGQSRGRCSHRCETAEIRRPAGEGVCPHRRTRGIGWIHAGFHASDPALGQSHQNCCHPLTGVDRVRLSVSNCGVLSLRMVMASLLPALSLVLAVLSVPNALTVLTPGFACACSNPNEDGDSNPDQDCSSQTEAICSRSRLDNEAGGRIAPQRIEVTLRKPQAAPRSAPPSRAQNTPSFHLHQRWQFVWRTALPPRAPSCRA
jgi:hypothetical protein